MGVIYTNHLKLRLKLRKIPKNYPLEIYEEPGQMFYNNLEENFISKLGSIPSSSAALGT